MNRFNLNASLKIILSAEVPEPLHLAAQDLARDIRSIADHVRPDIVSGSTVSDSILIAVVPEQFPAGSFEAYHVYSLPGNVLRIDGSDLRGAIYGIYEFSRRYLGIQPDHLWNMLPVRKLTSAEWSGIDFASGSPRIRYRGIFINDEDFLTGWDPGGTREVDYSFYHQLFSVRTAELIAETALRMGYNLAIPASFMDIRNPEEEELLKVFARRGFILSMHHIEPLGVSAFGFNAYWKSRGQERDYSYFTDPEAMREVWTDSIRRWSKYPEVIWQLGLRGRTDRPFWTVGSAPKTAEGRAAVIGKAISEQRDLVRQITGNPDPVCTATLWGEGSVFNRQGILPLPKEVIKVFADNCAGWRLQDDFFSSPVVADEHYGVYCHHAVNVGTHLAQAIGPADFHAVLKGALQVRPLDYAIFNVANVREFICGMTATARIARDPVAFSADPFLREWTETHFSACREEISQCYHDYFGAFEKNRRGTACWNDMLLLREVDLAVWKVYDQPDWVQNLDQTHLQSLTDMFPAIPDTQEKLASLERMLKTMTRIYRRTEALRKQLPEAERPFLYAQLVYPAGLYKAYCTAAISSVRGADAYAAKDYASAGRYFSAAITAMKDMEALVPDYLSGQFRHWYDLCRLVNFRDYTKKLEYLMNEKIDPMEPDKLLVLLVGQSNMAGRGYAGPDDLTVIPRLIMIRPDFKWQPAVEPITKDRKFIGTFQASGEKIVGSDPFETVLPQGDQKVCGVGLGRTFGRLLAEANPDRIVGLIPAAVGGTSIAAWMPGGVDDYDPENHPYDVAIRKAREAQKSGRIVAVLWHQGETDAHRQTPEYKEKLRTVIRNFRRDLNLGEDIPFIAGDLASFYKEPINAHIDIVDDALKEMAETEPGVVLVTTKDMTHRGDNLHFDTESLHALGKRYYDAYADFMKSRKNP